MPTKDVDCQNDSANPDQTAPFYEQSDLDLRCLPQCICTKTFDCYDIAMIIAQEQQLLE